MNADNHALVGVSLGPRSVESPTDAGATLVAGIDGINPAQVDGGGLVAPHIDSDLAHRVGHWSIDWWIGADDRWHVPAREPSVRQQRVGHGPIVETSLRVPSGDVIHTAYPALVDGHAVTVIEISNQSPVPVALAVAIRPYSATGPDGDERPRAGLELVGCEVGDVPRVAVDGQPLLWLPRIPNEAGAAAERDLFDDVSTGQTLSWDGSVAGPAANGVCLYPLPHRTSLRFVVSPLAGRSGRGTPLTTVDIDRLSEPEATARGWTAVVDRAARFEFPDPGVSGLAGAARARLVMAGADLAAEIVDMPAGAGTVLAGLAAGGHAQECRWSLDGLARSFPGRLPTTAADAAELISALGPASELVGDPDLTQSVLEVGAQLTHLVEREDAGVVAERAKLGLARLALAADQPEATARLLADITNRPDRAAGVPRATIDELTELAQQFAPAGRRAGPGLGSIGGSTTSDSVRAAAEFWLAARSLLIDEVGPLAGRDEPSATPAVRLLPEFPSAWLGGPVEVHQAPVAGVRVSFAIRWHGYRPALLWEVIGASGPLTLRCPGLDPEWETTESSGETLLAGTATELPDAPSPGDSFS